MNKAIFIDKDGTLIRDIPYNVNPGLITLEDRVAEGLQLLAENGYKLVIISNQSGIARGYFKEIALQDVKEKITSLLLENNIKLNGFYYCPHHPDGNVHAYAFNCTCRKPAPGMIVQAAGELEIDVEASWMIGDILHDVEAGNRAGCRTVLINNGNETEWVLNEHRKPFFTAADVYEAAWLICNTPSVNENNMERWVACKNILCIRADNMGDLLMSSPAFRALKQTFSCKITVLTSSMASSIAAYIKEIDEVITYDLPWVKTNSAIAAGSVLKLLKRSNKAILMLL